MFDIESADKVWEEIRAAERLRDNRLTCYESLKGRYTSPFFKGLDGVAADELDDNQYDPDNHGYETIRRIIPNTTYDAPRIRISSRTYGTDQTVKELTYGVNQWVLDNDYDEYIAGPVTDAQFAFGVSLMTVEDHPTLDGKRTVRKTRLSPRHYFMDPAALTRKEARYEGHRYIIDKDDLLERAEEEGEEGGWNLGHVRDLVEESGVPEYRKGQTKDIPQRDEVVVYEIWMKGLKFKDKPKANGGILTLGVSQGEPDGTGKDAAFLRDPMPYEGPEFGPYNMLGIWPVPDDPYPLASLVAEEGQARDVNRHARGISASAARRKKLVLINDPDGVIIDPLNSESHDCAVDISGAQMKPDEIQEFEVGGPSREMIDYYLLARNRLERTSGSDDQQAGRADADATATAVMVANENAEVGEDYVKLQVRRFVKRDIEGVLYYMLNDPDFSLVLGKEAARDLGVLTLEEAQQLSQQAAMAGDMAAVEAIAVMGERGLVMGPGDKLSFNIARHDQSVDLSTLALEIDPMSMERTTQGMLQRRVLELFQLVMTAGQAMPTMPHVDWESLLDKVGDGLNIPDLGDLFDPQVAAEMGAMMQQQGASQGQNPVASRPVKEPPSKGGGSSIEMSGAQSGGMAGGLAGRQ